MPPSCSNAWAAHGSTLLKAIRASCSSQARHVCPISISIRCAPALSQLPLMSRLCGHATGTMSPGRNALPSWRALNGKAVAAAAGPLGVGVLEHEAGDKIVLHPVHRAADEIEHAGAVDVECASRRYDLLVEPGLLGHIVDRIGKSRTAAPRGRKFDPDCALRCLG